MAITGAPYPQPAGQFEPSQLNGEGFWECRKLFEEARRSVTVESGGVVVAGHTEVRSPADDPTHRCARTPRSQRLPTRPWTADGCSAIPRSRGSTCFGSASSALPCGARRARSIPAGIGGRGNRAPGRGAGRHHIGVAALLCSRRVRPSRQHGRSRTPRSSLDAGAPTAILEQ